MASSNAEDLTPLDSLRSVGGKFVSGILQVLTVKNTLQ